MKKTQRLSNCILVALLTGAALAGGGGDSYSVDWSTIDGGGGTCAGGDLVLSGTVGQPDVGVMSGGDFELSGGFWTVSGGGVPCLADLDHNGAVDFGDILAVLSVWGKCPGCPEDLDGSGIVDFADILIILSAWGPCP